jgi:hypothetical protein
VEIYNKSFRQVIRPHLENDHSSEDRKKLLKEGAQYLAYMKKRKQSRCSSC